ncbi:MAG: M20/M25/M40 family metallo-hydrolase [Synergistaceae bacterium]|jgi:succinyl-diaminopimelate desuccinylase|nr:M20/M25/M40 family metallo-hydrolase [Synergistaceae bacterium]
MNFKDIGLDFKRILRLTQDLIRIRTSLPEGNELDLVKYIQALFEDYDVDCDIVYHGNNRASFVLAVKGQRSDVQTAFVGHVDTIEPISPREWVHAPYSADFEGGIIYGNGASNGKSGVAAMIYTALYLLENHIVPKNDVIMCFTADGDGNGIGAATICEGGFLRNASEIVFADPTNARIGIAQKGVLWLDVIARGRVFHVLDSARSVNSLARMFSMSEKIHAFIHSLPEHEVLGKSTSFMTNLNTGENEICTLPREARATFDIRYNPHINGREILNKIDEIARSEMADFPGLSVDVMTLQQRDPIGISEDAPIILALSECYGKLSAKPVKIGLGFFSDSSRIVPRLGVPFALLGPGDWIYKDRGDEFVLLESIVLVSRIYIDYLKGKEII